MGFYLQDDMWEGASVLPRKQRDEVVGALAQLYFDGTEAPLKGAALAVFLTCKERVLIAKSRSEASSRPKPRTNRKRTKAKSKANQNDIERESKSDSPIKEGERDREEDTDVSSIPPNPPEGDSRESNALGLVDPDDLPSDEPGDFEPLLGRPRLARPSPHLRLGAHRRRCAQGRRREAGAMGGFRHGEVHKAVDAVRREVRGVPQRGRGGGLR